MSSPRDLKTKLKDRWESLGGLVGASDASLTGLHSALHFVATRPGRALREKESLGRSVRVKRNVLTIRQVTNT